MNGSRAGTTDIVQRRTPDERVDSIGPQARYRCRARAFRPRTASRRAGNIADYDEVCAQPMASKLIW